MARKFWTKEKIELLFKCKTDKELLEAFPNHKVESLKRKKRYFKNSSVQIKDPTDIKSATLEEKLRGDLSFLKKQNKELKKKILSKEEIFGLFADEAFTSRQKFKLKTKKKKKKKNKPYRDGIVVLSDVQAGLVANKENIGVNEYSWDIFEKRLNKWSNAIVNDTLDYSKGHNVSSLRFVIPGDILEGHDIYSGQAYTLDRLAMEQLYYGVCSFEKAIIYIIESLTDVLGNIPIRFYCVVGNHGQPGGRKTSSTGILGLNYDYGFYLFLKKVLKLRGLNYGFYVSKQKALLFGSMKQIFCVVHGDEIVGWSGFPFYGLDKFEGKNIRYLDVLYKNIILGHHHQQTMLPAGRGKKFVNGCWCGATDLSSKKRYASAEEQLMLWNSKKYGITHVFNISLTDHDKVLKVPIYDKDLT